LVLVTGDDNSIRKRPGEPLDDYIHFHFQRLEEKLSDQKNSFTHEIKRSMTHDVGKVRSQLAVVQAALNEQFHPSGGGSYTSTKIQDFEDCYCGTLPFAELDDFVSFDKSLDDKEVRLKFVSIKFF